MNDLKTAIAQNLAKIESEDCLEVKAVLSKEGECRNIAFNVYKPKTRSRVQATGVLYSLTPLSLRHEPLFSSLDKIVNQYHLSLCELGMIAIIKSVGKVSFKDLIGLSGSSFYATKKTLAQLVGKGIVQVITTRDKGRFESFMYSLKELN